ncbi:hypothetical protein Syun_024903 [Stephania yunnanensis]|uniref:Uncharacterized protein n=1 Tax=Stephania yunnanensis TaxID=152371 RepID=A0AAP0HQR1_9MAGN
MRPKCRVWWPNQLSSLDAPQSTTLFGWFLDSSPSSIDIVVAPIALSPDVVSLQSELQGIVHSTNANMSLRLQEKSTFSLLGYCSVDYSSHRPPNGSKLLDGLARIHDDIYPQNNQDFVEEASGWSCGCEKLDRHLEQCRRLSVRDGKWIQLSYNFHRHGGGDIYWIPKLHHIHWNGQVVQKCDVHVIIYEPPVFGSHHFSSNSWGGSEQLRMHNKRPSWFEELEKKEILPELDTVILAINCAAAAEIVFEKSLAPRSSGLQLPTISMLFSTVCYLIAFLLASASTLVYLVLQFLHGLLLCSSQTLIHKIVASILEKTWKNIHIHACQLLYWPVILRGGSCRSQSSVEYAHMAAMRKHSMWSTIVIDGLLGNALGFALLRHSEAVCLFILNFVHDITNNLLRAGCVWLMGVPAGFKLNTELAETLGMISLNAIQIWSTLGFFVGFIFRIYIKMLALSGIMLGLTTSAALVRDTITIATLHVSTLHRWISLLYSLQIQALAALWRLFKGRKWNPLRQRFDSYDYNVEQHVVGSLLFTPLLLLLPTTSVFYIYFTILDTTTSFISILIEVAISVIHATPYTEIFLWAVAPRMFPSGIWFQIISGSKSNMVDSSEVHCSTESCSSFANKQQRDVVWEDREQPALVSILCSNFSDIGKTKAVAFALLLGWSCFSNASSVHGILTGQRMPSTLQSGLPPTMPWMSISCREYWRLCFNALLSCMTDRDCDG